MKRRDSGVRARSAVAVMAMLTAVTLPGCAITATVTTATTATDSRAERGLTASAVPSALSGTPSGRRFSPPTSKPTQTPAPAPAPTPAPRPKPSALPVGPPDAGALAQTQALPSTGQEAFRSVIHDFWLAVTTGNPAYAKPAFFPEKAYEQVKAIADPDYDWQYRLWYDFTLDVAAVRPLIGQHAKLLRIEVPLRYALWVPPNACYNNVGYWHVPGVRVVYEQGGATHSFGIASLISWRGDWYLIHLGALNRAAAVGLVDDPEPGPGAAGPPGGC